MSGCMSSLGILSWAANVSAKVWSCQEPMLAWLDARRNAAVLKAADRCDNMTQKENARTETQLAIARATMRAGKPF